MEQLISQIATDLLTAFFLIVGIYTLLFALNVVKIHPVVFATEFAARLLVTIIRAPFLLVGSLLKGLGQGIRRRKRLR